MKQARTVINEAKLKVIAAKALDMPEKPLHREVSAREAIFALKREIQTLQKRGYSLDEIAQFLSGQGLSISSVTLRAYLQRASAQKRAKKTPVQAPASTPHSVKRPADASKATFTPKPDSDEI